MPQFPQWKPPLASWTDAASVRRAQLSEAVSALAGRIGDVPRAISEEVRRRVNVLDLATRHDVELQSKLGRSRVSFVLKEFLEAQRVHDEELLESLRAEIQEELQSFAAAIDDDLFTTLAPPSSELDDDAGDADDDDARDDLDLVDHRQIESMADDIDLLDLADD
jgi:hypothetical protein